MKFLSQDEILNSVSQDLVTFNEEILNGKPHFLRSINHQVSWLFQGISSLSFWKLSRVDLF